MNAELERLIERHRLQPHPEGGWYRETFRSDQTICYQNETISASTAILFLLGSGDVSRWHQIPQDEVWHWHDGAALELIIANETSVQTYRLDAKQPQVVVPGGAWQAARSTGAWTLMGCTVAPGFDFRWFNLIKPGSPAPTPAIANWTNWQNFA
jgi:predicted cupin superfamily sugar epimerase